MTKSIIKAGLKHTASGFKKRSKKEQEILMRICIKCEYFIAIRKIGSRCKKCGCCISLKQGWASAHCPINKW